MKFPRFLWRYKVAERRLVDTIDRLGGGAELRIIIRDFMDTSYIRDSYSKLYNSNKLEAFLIKAAKRSAVLGVLEFISISGDDVERKFFIHRAATKLRGAT